MKFNKILFPVDLSEASPKIVPYVTEMAHKFDSEIHILFVARAFQYFTSMYVPHPSVDLFETAVTEGGRKSIEEFADKYFKDPEKIKIAIVNGDAAEEIINYIKGEDIDLLIMGTHGRKGLDKLIFGSVAEKVTKTTPIPMMLINPYKTKN
ncbi:MAG: universal stress protein [Proteobacteria bacterium]|nr:universal stress protein [Pseudomonadota bacterium]MBU4011004.1 universal stress protein [Pseudomonadota bacterium]